LEHPHNLPKENRNELMSGGRRRMEEVRRYSPGFDRSQFFPACFRDLAHFGLQGKLSGEPARSGERKASENGEELD
jgi:hypothetical protein